jgi:hypothetical protein
MSSAALVEIITATGAMDKLSTTSVDRARHRLGSKFLPPITEYTHQNEPIKFPKTMDPSPNFKK